MPSLGIVLLIFILIMAVAFQNVADMWRRSFCNDDGTPSFARVILAFVILVIASWADVSVKAKMGIPEIPSTWMNLLYGLMVYAFGKKVLDTVQAVKGVANVPPA